MENTTNLSGIFMEEVSVSATQILTADATPQPNDVDRTVDHADAILRDSSHVHRRRLRVFSIDGIFPPKRSVGGSLSFGTTSSSASRQYSYTRDPPRPNEIDFHFPPRRSLRRPTFREPAVSGFSREEVKINTGNPTEEDQQSSPIASQADTEEVSKLDDALHATQSQLEKAVPVVKETPVIVQDIERIDSLTNEVERLKALLALETQKTAKAKHAYDGAMSQNGKLNKKLEEAGRKMNKLQVSVRRLEEKVFNLESENQVLRQKEFAIIPAAKALTTRPKSTIIQRTFEKENFLNGEIKKVQEHQDLLIKCISQDRGFSEGKPVTACLILKCLLHWRSFEVERTSIFDRILQTIGSAIEIQDDNYVLTYWLSNSATLLVLLQRTLIVSGAATLTPPRPRATASMSLFLRMDPGLGASPQSAELSSPKGRDELGQVEAKYPAFLFKQQLTELLKKIYGMIRDNLKKEIAPLLDLCIQAPRISRAVTQQALMAHWQSIVKSLNNCLRTMRANYVPSFLISKVSGQIFAFINVQLFNSLLLRRECCSFSNGVYIKTGLAELERWCHDAIEEFAGSALEELKHIRQAVGFLLIHLKTKKSLSEITNYYCPVLSIQQLYRISIMYWDDKHNMGGVSPEVISSMRVMMAEELNNGSSSSFLLDVDSSISFSLDDISKSTQQIEVAYIDLPPLIRQTTVSHSYYNGQNEFN